VSNVLGVGQFIYPCEVPIPEKSRLEGLFSGISAFIEANDLTAALRLADCASRIAPDDAQCTLVHARLLIKLGLPHEALRRLLNRREPEAIVERAFALHLMRSDREAVELCETLLASVALDSLSRLKELASTLCWADSDSGLAGWVGVNTSLHLQGEARYDRPLTVKLDDSFLSASIIDANEDLFYSFLVELPAGRSGRISISSGGREFLGSDFIWPPNFGLSGWVMAEDRGVRGKIRMDWAPDLPITLNLQRSGVDCGRHTVIPSPIAGCDFSAATLFQIDVETGEGGSSPLHVSAVLPDGRFWPMVGSPIVWGSDSASGTDIATIAFSHHHRPETAPSGIIDIVVPVYAGYDETLSCLKSILATTSRTEVELVVVNDASPDSRLCAALDGLASEGLITRLTNECNLGFPGSANAGIKLHSDRDVVLVNSDTELFGDWLERLKAAAYSDVKIGTVTPLGEAASVVSYPDDDENRYTRAEAQEIDCIARDVNRQKLVDLPVGVGFCLYVKRSCLAETGWFNEVVFGKGYGEENDFCLRASRLGWRHVATPNLFVRHQGAKSFGPMKAALMERNGQVLNRLHPGYDARITEFAATDPLLDARRAIDIQRLIRSARHAVLLVTCNLMGGVKRHVDMRKVELAGKGHTVLVLQPANTDLPAQQIRLLTPDENINNLLFSLPRDLEMLRQLLDQLRLEKVELHHFAGLPGTALEIASELGIRYEVFVHDYSWICPRLTLSNGTGGYCGEPAVEDCELCIVKHGTFLDTGLTVKALRERSARILDGADTVVVPSNDVRMRLTKYFPARPVEVTSWEALGAIPSHERPAASAATSLKVAIIGAISVAKGFRVVLECALNAAERRLDIEFIVIGFTCDDEALLATGCVFITGPYSDDEVAALLAREGCRVAFFSSIVPETWCYALTHALVQGLPVLAFDLGSIPERLKGYGAAQLLPLSSPAPAINDALLQLARTTAISNTPEVTVMDSNSAATVPPAIDELQTSVQFLPLPAGTYTITVKGGAPETASPGEMVLPAVQVGVAPARSEGTIEFLARGGTTDRWLVRRRDMIIARITGGDASLMLTSVSLPTSPALGIDIRRLDPDLLFVDPETERGSDDTREVADVIPAQIVAHIHRVGDVPFRDGLAGCIGDGLWIEAFAIGPFGQLTPDLIEYCGVTADGYQTPWLDNQTLCGSRGRSIPMVGCAIRLKPAISDRYDCEYTGQFVSGRVLGPFKNGDLCCSDIPSDPLWGLELFAKERAQAAGETSLS
jgi:GT2 family glycosyltransferase/glycosyltransferase involved in cell wall biosynthesis